MKYHKLDGFYTEAHNILRKPVNTGTVRMKLSSRAMVTPKVVAAAPIEKFNCISCFAQHNVFERNIRGRILRGYMVTKDGKMSIQHLPGVPVKPTYHNGRLCEACFPKYTAQAVTPTDYQSIQLLKDFAKNVTHDPGVTIASVQDEDLDQERALEQAQKDARPKHGRLTIDVGVVASKSLRRHVCMKCSDHNGSDTLKCSSCGERVTTEDLKPDPKAFHKFMRSRGGGVKNYESNMIKQFDSDINYSNIKRG
jgi:ribosomal protein L40E